MGRVTIFGETVDYNPFMDDMYKENLRIRLKTNPSYKRVFKRNVTDAFFNTLKQTVDPSFLHEQNMIISMFGKTGTGKSIVAMSICRHVVPDRFDYNNIVFFDSEILEKAPHLPNDSFMIRDEGVDKAVYGVGSQRQSSQLNVLAETARKSGLNLFFIEPEYRENELAKYYMETVDMDVEKRITRIALIEPYSKQYIGGIYVPILNENDNDWVQYNKNKDYFIEQVKSGRLNKAKVDYRDLAVDMAGKIDTDVFQHKKDREAFIQAKFPNYTNSEVKVIQTFVEAVLKNGPESIYEEHELDEKYKEDNAEEGKDGVS